MARARVGAAREGHLWRQTESEVELSLLLPPATRAKDLRPELRPSPEPAAAASVLVHRSGAGAAPLLEAQGGSEGSPEGARGLTAAPLGRP